MVSGLIVAICLFAASAFSMRGAGVRSHGSVYYLIWETDSLQASSALVEVQGGAGFVMKNGVAIDVYFSLSDAQAAKSSLETYCKQIVILEGIFDNSVSSILWAGLHHVKGWQEALQNGATQSVVRSGLQDVAKKLAFYAKNAKDMKAAKIANELQILTTDVIYAQKLRYFLCSVCERLVERSEMMQ